ncbi:MAG: hypothetical protein ACJ74U_04585 [Jatrophihabitantaceae bacterium]
MSDPELPARQPDMASDDDHTDHVPATRPPEAAPQRTAATPTASEVPLTFETDEGAAFAPVAPPSPPRRWSRPTVRQLKRAEEAHADYTNEHDNRWNSDTRLPAEESIHLGGVTLVEAFTPSTVSNLYSVLRKWPKRWPGREDDWTAALERSRAGASGGWTTLGIVRRGSGFIAGDGHQDQSLPEGVQAAWLNLNYLLPSVAIVTATFAFEDDFADLSSILRSDFETQYEDVKIEVYGPLGRYRQHIPWSRPKQHGSSAQILDVPFGKRRSIDDRVRERERACGEWFYAQFPGRFASAAPQERPTFRLLFTEQARPFEGRTMWLEPVGLDWSPNVYRCTDLPGWALKSDRRPIRGERYVVTVAARRGDVGKNGATDMTGRSNWSLTQRFSREQHKLAAVYSLVPLLDIYGGCLARLRDEASKKRRIRRPVNDARRLDRYLVTDGLDAATIAPDISAYTDDLMRFRWNVPEYTEDQTEMPERFKRDPIEFVPQLCEVLHARSGRIIEDTANTDGNIRASAELRQAVANTRLQRTVVLFTIAAVLLAIITLVHGG